MECEPEARSGEGGAELLDAHPGETDQLAERPRSQLAMIRDRQRRDAAGLGQDHGTARLTAEGPPEPLEGARASWPETTGSSGNGYVHLDGAHRERHPFLGPHFETPDDGLPNIGDRLVLGSPLADATGDRGALRDDHAGLVTFQDDGQLHGIGPYQAAQEGDNHHSYRPALRGLVKAVA